MLKWNLDEGQKSLRFHLNTIVLKTNKSLMGCQFWVNYLLGGVL